MLAIAITEHIRSEMSEVDKYAKSLVEISQETQEMLEKEDVSPQDLHCQCVRAHVVSDMLAKHVAALSLINKELLKY